MPNRLYHFEQNSYLHQRNANISKTEHFICAYLSWHRRSVPAGKSNAISSFPGTGRTSCSQWGRCEVRHHHTPLNLIEYFTAGYLFFFIIYHKLIHTCSHNPIHTQYNTIFIFSSVKYGTSCLNYVCHFLNTYWTLRIPLHTPQAAASCTVHARGRTQGYRDRQICGRWGWRRSCRTLSSSCRLCTIQCLSGYIRGSRWGKVMRCLVM